MRLFLIATIVAIWVNFAPVTAGTVRNQGWIENPQISHLNGQDDGNNAGWFNMGGQKPTWFPNWMAPPPMFMMPVMPVIPIMPALMIGRIPLPIPPSSSPQANSSQPQLDSPVLAQAPPSPVPPPPPPAQPDSSEAQSSVSEPAEAVSDSADSAPEPDSAAAPESSLDSNPPPDIESTVEADQGPETDPTSDTVSTTEVDPTPDSAPAADPDPTPESDPTPDPDPTPESDPTPDPDPTPESDPTPDPDPTPESDPTPDPDPTPESDPTPDPDPITDPDPTPNTESSPDTDQTHPPLIQTSTTPYAKCKLLPYGDWIFVLDGSSSISDDDFDRMTTFIAALVGAMNIGQNTSQIGIVQFGGGWDNDETTRTEFDLGEYSTKTELLEKIDHIRQMEGGTMIGQAMQYALTNEFETNRNRKNYPDYMVVITDGQDYSFGEGTNIPTAAENAKKMNVDTFALGVGYGVDEAQLQEIAGGNGNKVYTLKSFMELVKETEVVCEQIIGNIDSNES